MSAGPANESAHPRRSATRSEYGLNGIGEGEEACRARMDAASHDAPAGAPKMLLGHLRDYFLRYRLDGGWRVGEGTWAVTGLKQKGQTPVIRSGVIVQRRFLHSAEQDPFHGVWSALNLLNFVFRYASKRDDAIDKQRMSLKCNPLKRMTQLQHYHVDEWHTNRVPTLSGGSGLQ
jgi:hypothetical protein